METKLERATRLTAEMKAFSEGQSFFLKQAKAFPSEAPKHKARAAAAGSLLKIREQQVEELIDDCAKQILATPSEEGRFTLHDEGKMAFDAVEVIASARVGHRVTVSGITVDGGSINISYRDLS